MTDPHQIVEQIDRVIEGHEEAIELLKVLRRKVAAERKWNGRETVNAWGMPIIQKFPAGGSSKVR